jgi:hypothetical protein
VARFSRRSIRICTGDSLLEAKVPRRPSATLGGIPRVVYAPASPSLICPQTLSHLGYGRILHRFSNASGRLCYCCISAASYVSSRTTVPFASSTTQPSAQPPLLRILANNRHLASSRATQPLVHLPLLRLLPNNHPFSGFSYSAALSSPTPPTSPTEQPSL